MEVVMPSTARERELTDALWERVCGFIPPPQPNPKGGRPFADDKDCFRGIVYVLRNGIRWNDLPREFPSDTTCWRRMRDWVQAGIWDQVHRIILAELKDAGEIDTSELFADATFAEARKGGSRRVKRPAALV
jgi:transposase